MERLVAADRAAGVPGQARIAEELRRLVFDGLELVEPGLLPDSERWPEGSGPRPTAAEVSPYGESRANPAEGTVT
jgi:hypothetical protein